LVVTGVAGAGGGGAGGVVVVGSTVVVEVPLLAGSEGTVGPPAAEAPVPQADSTAVPATVAATISFFTRMSAPSARSRSLCQG
jgi:hypothetical protein